jgi:CBS domain-containing protein
MRHAKTATRANRDSAPEPLPSSDPRLAALTVKDVMSAQPVCVDGSLSVEAARTLMLERGVSALPIVDSEGRPIGIVSKTDLLREIPEYEYREFRQERPSRPPDPLEVEPDDGDDESDGFFVVKMPVRPVTEVMTPYVVVLEEATPLSRAAQVMVDERVHRLPIVDEQGKVTGILSTLDIVRLLAVPRPTNGAAVSVTRQRRE